MLHFLCRCSYLCTFHLSFQSYWHIRLKSTAYFFLTHPVCTSTARQAYTTHTAAYWRKKTIASFENISLFQFRFISLNSYFNRQRQEQYNSNSISSILIVTVVTPIGLFACCTQQGNRRHQTSPRDWWWPVLSHFENARFSHHLGLCLTDYG